MVSLECRRANIQRLEANFSTERRQVKYSLEQMRSIDNAIRDLTDTQFARMVDKFIARERALPMPGKFMDEVRTLRLKQEQYRAPHVAEEIGCRLCMDSGYVLHAVSDEAGLSVYANCLCKAAEPNRLGAVKDLGKRITHTGEALPFPKEAFAPRGGKPGDLKHVFSKAQQWLVKLENSRDFWAAQKPKGGTAE